MAPDVRWVPGRVTSGGESIYYEVTCPASNDAATTIVLGHGAGGSHAAWFQQVPVLAAAGYRVITWDTRGFGCSTCTTGVLDVDASVQDLTAVLDEVGCQTAVIVGQSMGGWWASGFALAHPERVEKLVLANTVGGLWTDALLAHFATLGANFGEQDRLGVHPALGTTLVGRDAPLAFLYQQINTFHSPPMALVLGALSAPGIAHDAFRALPIPKLWITSSADPLFPGELVRESAERIDARVAVIDDAGHSPYFERAQEWNRALFEFLDAAH